MPRLAKRHLINFTHTSALCAHSQYSGVTTAQTLSDDVQDMRSITAICMRALLLSVSRITDSALSRGALCLAALYSDCIARERCVCQTRQQINTTNAHIHARIFSVLYNMYWEEASEEEPPANCTLLIKPFFVNCHHFIDAAPHHSHMMVIGIPCMT